MIASMGEYKRASALEVITVCIALLVTLSGIQFVWLQGPIDRDQSLYFVVAHLLLKGARLYTDVWDHKPPAIHAAYALAQSVAGYSVNAIWLLSVLVNLLSGVGIYLLTKRFGAQSAGAALALTIWILLSMSPNLEAATPNTEAFINACWITAAVLLTGERRAVARAIGAGLCAALASLFKQISLLLFLPLALLAVQRSGRRGRGVVGLLLSIVGIPIAAWALVFGYFSYHGRGDEFYQAVFQYNSAYAGSVLDNIAKMFSLRALFPIHALALFLPWILIALSTLRMLGRKETRSAGAFILMLACTTYIVIALPGRNYTHYYQYLLPPTCVLTGVISTGILGRWYRWILISVLALILIWELPLAIIPELMRRAPTNPSSLRMNARKIIPEIHASVPSDGWFYLWGAEPELYFESGIEPRHRALHVDWLLDGPQAERLTRETLAVLQRDPPAIVIFEREFLRPEIDRNLVYRWIMEHYREPRRANTAEPFVILKPR